MNRKSVRVKEMTEEIENSFFLVQRSENIEK